MKAHRIMVRQIKLLVLYLVISTLLASVPAIAHDFEKLNLSAQQKQQLKTLGDNMKRQFSDLRGKLHENRKALGQLYASYDLNEKKAKAQIQKINGIQFQLLSTGLDNQLKIRKILSQDQFQQLVKLQQDRAAEFKDRHQHKDTIEGDKLNGVGKALQKSDLTPDQKEKLRKMYHRHEGNHYEGGHFGGIGPGASEIMKLYSSYNLDPKQARAAIKRVNKLQLDYMMGNLDRQKELRKVLNADQFAAARAEIAADWRR